MQRRVMQWHRGIGFALVLFLAAGCFQAVGTDFQATDAAQAPPTFTPIPSDTPFPTNTPEAELTSPPDISFGPVDTSVDPLALLTPPGVEIAQQPTLDPILQTVTAIYAQGEEALAVQETPVPVDTLDPIAITATYIVERATLTQAALDGVPVQLPTPTPPAGEVPIVETPVPAPVVPGADCIHEVRATDRNLYRIALNYGVTVQEIAQASGIVNPDLIYVGQKLTIPGCGTTGAQPLPTSTPTGGAVIDAPAQTGATPVPGVTFTPIPPGQTFPTARTHTVMQGETLFQISLQYGVTVHQIAAVNGISNINLIYIGQQLTIP